MPTSRGCRAWGTFPKRRSPQLCSDRPWTIPATSSSAASDVYKRQLHREANTLGSKSAALELTKISVDMKVLIEQMREQVQNIE